MTTALSSLPLLPEGVPGVVSSSEVPLTLLVTPLFHASQLSMTPLRNQALAYLRRNSAQ